MERSRKNTTFGFSWSFNRLLKRSLASVAMFGLLATQTYASDKEVVAVTISPAVQEQIQKANPDEQKKIGQVINMGNKFIPHHFDGSAYARNDDQETEKWKRNIRPLINRDNADWYTPGGVFNNQTPTIEINGQKTSEVVVCPQAELISVNTFEDHYELNYRSKIIGKWKTNSTTFTEADILLDEKEEFDEVLIKLDKSNKVSQVSSKFAALVSIPKNGIELFKAYVNRPELIDTQLQGGINDELTKYKHYIVLIENEEAISCKGTSTKVNKLSGGE